MGCPKCEVCKKTIVMSSKDTAMIFECSVQVFHTCECGTTNIISLWDAHTVASYNEATGEPTDA